MDLASFILALALTAAGGGSTPPDSTDARANIIDVGVNSQPAPETPPETPDARSHIIDLG